MIHIPMGCKTGLAICIILTSFFNRTGVTTLLGPQELKRSQGTSSGQDMFTNSGRAVTDKLLTDTWPSLKHNNAGTAPKALPGEPAAYNHGLLSMNYGLHLGMVALL